MNEALIYALSKRIDHEEMTIEQVPLPYQEAVQAILDGDSNG